MDNKPFTKPSEETISKMTVVSVSTLLQTLKAQRAELVRPHDERIKFYEAILERKKEEERNRNQTTTLDEGASYG